MTKRVIKFSLGALGMVLVGLGVLYGLRFFSPEYQQEQEAMRRLEAIEQQYKNDTYGGDTPEKTLQLFIDALKKGDIDLAAKYFVIDKQEEWKKDLQLTMGKGLFSIMVQDLENLKNPYTIGQGDNIQFVFEAYDEKKLVLQVTVIKGSNGKWKIEDM
jgi:Cu/Ag efflux protein CusF